MNRIESAKDQITCAIRHLVAARDALTNHQIEQTLRKLVLVQPNTSAAPVPCKRATKPEKAAQSQKGKASQ